MFDFYGNFDLSIYPSASFCLFVLCLCMFTLSLLICVGCYLLYLFNMTDRQIHRQTDMQIPDVM